MVRETEALDAAGVLGQVEESGRRVGLLLGSKKPGAVLKIGITSAITPSRAKEIALAISEIAVIALPIY